MQNVVVAGGAGGVGEGIVRALLATDVTVIVTSRDPLRLEGLRARVGAANERLVTVEANVGRLDAATAAAERLARDFERLDAVIPSLGGWWEGGPLAGVTGETWDAVMDEMLRTHFVFARAFLPVLRAQGGGRYIAIGGSAADAPIRNASLVCIAGAAQLMMTRALALENAGSQLEIMELVVEGPVRTRDWEHLAAPHWTTADEIGAIVCDLVVHGRTSDALTTTHGPIVRMHPRRRAEKDATP